MGKPLAYIMAGQPRPEVLAAVAESRHPRAEYNLLLRRDALRLMDYGCLEDGAGPVARFFIRREKLHFALAAEAVARADRYAGLIATGDEVGLPLAMMARLRSVRKPVYIITHGSYFGSEKFATFARIIRRKRSLHFLCLSETLRRALVEEFGVPAAQAHNTSYGVDLDFFRPMPAPVCSNKTCRPLVASAGMAMRDYRTLIEAAGPLDVELKMATDSAWFPSRLDIHDMALPEFVERRSYGDYAGLRDLYARAAFVVVPLYDARHAAGYAVIAEAMAMGKAVITTKTAAHSDFVEDGVTGLYVRPGDAADLREKMRTLLDDPALAARLGRCARARMEERFSVEAYAERIARAVGLPAQAGAADGFGTE